MPTTVMNGATATLQLYGMNGRLIGSHALQADTLIDASGLVSGAYVYTISSCDRVWRSGKVIVGQ
ncbi:MAG: T9SS type A sorting domain-containing protein [Flavobacteriales bacterium]|nr:T9SS type A sorting domain-containing protein [Flavobacteriales bacterium]